MWISKKWWRDFETKSREEPTTYRTNVVLLALPGLVILAIIVGGAGAIILLLIAVPIALWIGGIHNFPAFVSVGKVLRSCSVRCSGWSGRRATT